MPKINIKENRKKADQKVRFISLVVTSDCNLCCKYCYEKHELRDKKIMNPTLAKEIICNYMQEEVTDFVEIDFFGGEPLLAFDFIREVVDWFHTCSWNKKHHFLIGTNGTILNEDIKDWLYKNRRCVTVGLSLDGTKTAHDICRSNSYDSVYKNLPFFKKYWYHQPAKMTICTDTIPYTCDSVIELEEMDLLFTANLAFENAWGDEQNKSSLLEIYEDQLSRLVDFYSERTDLYPVGPLLTSVPDYLGIPGINEMKKKEIKRYCGAGHEMLVIDTDGSIYPCHRFIPWITGKPAPKEKVNCQTVWNPVKCAECKLIHSCPTCAGFNWEINGDTGIRTTFHCESFKLEVMASCMIEWKRMQKKLDDVNTMTIEEKIQIKRYLDAVSELLEKGI
jgi:uncharacterized protein